MNFGILFVPHNIDMIKYNIKINERPKARALRNSELIQTFILENYKDKNFGVEMMAREFGVCVTYLREIIGFSFGICPQKLIEGIRLQKSLELFEKGLKEYQIANLVGYSNARSFRRAFKKRFCILPISFKNMVNCKDQRVFELHRNLIDKLWSTKTKDLSKENIRL